VDLSRRFALLAAMLLLTGTVFSGGLRTLAQDDATPDANVTAETDATPDTAAAATDEGRPAHVHTGSCDSVGEVVAPLTNLTAASGTPSGQFDDDDDLVEYSFTNVPLSLDDMLAADHVVNVHETTENIENYIACGEIGGVVDANGSLVISLHELNGSGFSGIAVLTQSATDPATTDISAFVHRDYDDNGSDDVTDDSGNDSADDATDDSGSDATDDSATGGTDDATPDTDA
jgi:hypothetical protein